MKFKTLLTASAIALSIATACRESHSSADSITSAEEAYDAGQYDEAQDIADRLVAGGDLDNLSVDRLCRLSLLLMHLAEVQQDYSGNVALAVNVLDIAASRDSDSTAAYISSVDIGNRASMALLKAVSNVYHIDADSLTIYDDCPDYESDTLCTHTHQH